MSSTPAFRIAIRREGEQIVAYIAQMDTMTGAFPVATLHAGAAVRDAEVWVAFQALCKLIAKGAAAELGCDLLSVETRDAPEHEKAGRA